MPSWVSASYAGQCQSNGAKLSGETILAFQSGIKAAKLDQVYHLEPQSDFTARCLVKSNISNAYSILMGSPSSSPLDSFRKGLGRASVAALRRIGHTVAAAAQPQIGRGESCDGIPSRIPVVNWARASASRGGSQRVLFHHIRMSRGLR